MVHARSANVTILRTPPHISALCVQAHNASVHHRQKAYNPSATRQVPRVPTGDIDIGTSVASFMRRSLKMRATDNQKALCLLIRTILSLAVMFGAVSRVLYIPGIYYE